MLSFQSASEYITLQMPVGTLQCINSLKQWLLRYIYIYTVEYTGTPGVWETWTFSRTAKSVGRVIKRKQILLNISTWRWQRRSMDCFSWKIYRIRAVLYTYTKRSCIIYAKRRHTFLHVLNWLRASLFWLLLYLHVMRQIIP